MRRVFIVLHRWAGLFMAAFLFLAGLTGAIIAWDHELDAALNPALFHAAPPRPDAEPIAPLELAAALEKREPELRVRYMPLAHEPGKTMGLFVEPVAEQAKLGFDQVALDPYTGEVRGRRQWGKLAWGRAYLIPMLYKLHYTLHLPEAFGVETGVLFMGIVGIVWTLDAFVALVISFPRGAFRKGMAGPWRKSFAFRVREGGFRLVYDLHRSAGVWAWLCVLTLAITSVSMNLGPSVTRPLVSLFSRLAPSPFEPVPGAPEPPRPDTRERLPREALVARAREEARARNVAAPLGAIFCMQTPAVCGVGFFAPGSEHGDGGLGNPWIYLDATDGRLLQAQIPGQGTAGDVFMQAQFPVHSGRIFGTFGRVLVTLMGLFVASLSVTGVVIWAKKRKAKAGSRATAAANASRAVASMSARPTTML